MPEYLWIDLARHELQLWTLVGSRYEELPPDEQITRILQSQGINVTRRTVAKYREDMKIPSTHQRRVKD